MTTKAAASEVRIGYLLDEEATKKVVEISDYMKLTPDKFFDHCINVMWRAYTKNG